MRRLMATLLVALGAAACNSQNSSPGSGIGTTPTPPTSTERFAGTVSAGGRIVHPFTVTLSGGELTLQLTSASPNVSLGLGIGRFANNTCTALTGGTVVAPAGTQPQLAGSIDAGSYCALVFDPSTLQADVAYAITVTHY